MKQLDLKTFASGMPPATFNRLVAELRSATEIRLGNEVLGKLVSPQRKVDLAAKPSARVADEPSLPDSLSERLDEPTVDEPHGISESERIMAEISLGLQAMRPDPLLPQGNARLFVFQQCTEAHWESSDGVFNVPSLIRDAIERATGRRPKSRAVSEYHRLIQAGTLNLPDLEWDPIIRTYVWHHPRNSMTAPTIANN